MPGATADSAAALTTPIERTRAPGADAPSARESELLAGRYLILRRLGAGGMGAVYLAHDQHFLDPKLHVAVKFIRKSLLDEHAYNLFREETRQLIKLTDIDGVLTITDNDLDDPSRPYIVTQLIEGWDLAEFVRHKVPPRNELLRIVADVCDTLDVVHDAGVIHRDLKPSNIMIRSRAVGGRHVPVIVDFGIAVETRHHAGKSPGQAGTPNYMSPEHVRGAGSVTRRSDVFSLGVVLYWLLCEGRAYPYDTNAAGLAAMLDRGQEAPIRPLPAPCTDAQGRQAGVPETLAQIVYKALAVLPEHRYAHAGQLGRALRQFIDEQTQYLTGAGDAGPTQARPELLHHIDARRLSLKQMQDHPTGPAGGRFGEFSFEQFLGSGPTGLTYSLRSDKPGRWRVRILNPPLSDPPAVARALERMLERTRLLQAFGVQAPIRVGSVHFEDTRTFYVLSEFAAGQDLLELAARDTGQVHFGPVTETQLRLAFDLFRALDQIQRHPMPAHLATSDLGPYHGRLSLRNVLARPSQPPLLLDFGMSALVPLLQPWHSQRPELRCALPPRDGHFMSQMAAREARSAGQLLRSFFFFNSPGLIAIKPPEETWPDGLAALDEVRRAIARSADRLAARDAADAVLARRGQRVALNPLIRQLICFLLHDLNPPGEAPPRLTDMHQAAMRVAEVAALGPGATPEMAKVLDAR